MDSLISRVDEETRSILNNFIDVYFEASTVLVTAYDVGDYDRFDAGF